MSFLSRKCVYPGQTHQQTEIEISNSTSTNLSDRRYDFVPCFCDPHYGSKDGYSSDKNVYPMVSVIPFVDGRAGAIWGIQEFIDRINNLKEMVQNGVAATSKEYDPFMITDHSCGKAGDESDQEEDGDRGSCRRRFFLR